MTTDTPIHVTTSQFTVPPSLYVRDAIEHIMGRYWWAMLTPLAAMAAYGALIDWRWLFVAIITIIMGIPVLQFFGWIKTLGLQGAANVLFPCTLEFDSATGTITFTYAPVPAEPPTAEDTDDNATSSTETHEDIPERRLDPLIIDMDRISRCALWHDHLAISAEKPQTFVLVPLQTFKSLEEAAAMYHFINRHLETLRTRA